ncbi:MAG: phage tail protein [Sphingorhabdus sp.]
MATLVLSAVGTAIGGPIGGAIGAIIGQVADQKILGSGKSREGPRLKELDIQTSSYGSRVPAIFGKMRVAGTVFWATDLVETRRKEGGGKGRPSTNSYSYAANLAVALSSRPLDAIGRIWADGNLLRGAAGDFKVETEFRFHDGHEDQPVDPLIASDVGPTLCPASRGMAYAVFENLQLAEYGNRIPQLTFEVIEREGHVPLHDIFRDASKGLVAGTSGEQVTGYALDGSDARSGLGPLLDSCPIFIVPADDGFRLKDWSAGHQLKLATTAAQHGGRALPKVTRQKRPVTDVPKQYALRYYEPARDFQLGVQKSERAGSGYLSLEVDLPVAIQAATAKKFADLKLLDMQRSQQSVTWHIMFGADILVPGDSVLLPEAAGSPYRITETENFNGYQRIEARRALADFQAAPSSAVPGAFIPAPDWYPGSSEIAILDLPAIGEHDLNKPLIVVAAAGNEAAWRGASLSVQLGDNLVDIGRTAQPAIMGALVQALSSHTELLIDTHNEIEIELMHAGMQMPPGAGDPLSAGAPLLWVAGELVRYGEAEQVSPTGWKMRNLLRGCFGTSDAVTHHPAEARCVLIEEEALKILDTAQFPAGTNLGVEALGLGDNMPVVSVQPIGKIALIPRSPVHGAGEIQPNGDILAQWIRRSRADIGWIDSVDQPIAEESEGYYLSVFQGGLQKAEWTVAAAQKLVTAGELASYGIAGYSNIAFQVSQIGRYGRSSALEFSLPAGS